MHIANALTLLFATAASALPATAGYTDPPKDPNPCTTKSTHTKNLVISDFKYHGEWTFSTPAHQIAGGEVSFKLHNPSAVYDAVCKAYSTRLEDFFYGEVEYACTVPKDNGDPFHEVTFSFNAANHALAANQTWSCAKEGSHFAAQAKTKLDLDCKRTSYTNPKWKQGQIYSSRTLDCKTKGKTANVGIYAIQGVM